MFELKRKYMETIAFSNVQLPYGLAKKKTVNIWTNKKKMHRKMINLLKSICADGTKRYEQTKQQK